MAFVATEIGLAHLIPARTKQAGRFRSVSRKAAVPRHAGASARRSVITATGDSPNSGFKAARFGDQPLWQQIHRPGSRDDDASAAVPVASAEEEAAEVTEKGPAPLWSSVHLKGKDTPMWQKVNSSRTADDSSTLTAEPEESEPSPKILDIEMGAAPAWQRVHSKKATEPSDMWQTVRTARDGAQEWPVPWPWKSANGEDAPADEVQKLEITSTGASPIWQRVHHNTSPGVEEVSQQQPAMAAAVAPVAVPQAPKKLPATVKSEPSSPVVKNLIFGTLLASVAAFAFVSLKSKQPPAPEPVVATTTTKATSKGKAAKGSSPVQAKGK